jgi:hypothetical protein
VDVPSQPRTVWPSETAWQVAEQVLPGAPFRMPRSQASAGGSVTPFPQVGVEPPPSGVLDSQASPTPSASASAWFALGVSGQLSLSSSMPSLSRVVVAGVADAVVVGVGLGRVGDRRAVVVRLDHAVVIDVRRRRVVVHADDDVHVPEADLPDRQAEQREEAHVDHRRRDAGGAHAVARCLLLVETDLGDARHGDGGSRRGDDVAEVDAVDPEVLDELPDDVGAGRHAVARRVARADDAIAVTRPPRMSGPGSRRRRRRCSCPAPRCPAPCW